MRFLKKFVTIILVGGLGTKLGDEASKTPKCLLDIGGIPLIQRVLNYSNISKFSQKIIISAGHLGEQVQEFFHNSSVYSQCPIEIDLEYQPLGTGGALARLFQRYGLSSAMVMNGDLLLKAKSNIFDEFYSAVSEASYDSKLSGLFAVASVPDTHWKYEVERDAMDYIVSFRKNYDSNHEGIVNIGLYWLRRDIPLSYQHTGVDGICSLERHILPAAISDGKNIRAHLFFPNIFMDMTTMDDFSYVNDHIKDITKKLK